LLRILQHFRQCCQIKVLQIAMTLHHSGSKHRAATARMVIQLLNYLREFVVIGDFMVFGLSSIKRYLICRTRGWRAAAYASSVP